MRDKVVLPKVRINRYASDLHLNIFLMKVTYT
jgi:hypothetical protein